jgi:hypothetical protein
MGILRKREFIGLIYLDKATSEYPSLIPFHMQFDMVQNLLSNIRSVAGSGRLTASERMAGIIKTRREDRFGFVNFDLYPSV